eukprot:1191214-Prorocentrum_minimum.AAC.1
MNINLWVLSLRLTNNHRQLNEARASGYKNPTRCNALKLHTTPLSPVTQVHQINAGARDLANGHGT